MFAKIVLKFKELFNNFKNIDESVKLLDTSNGGVLSDRDIITRIKYDSLIEGIDINDGCIQPASVDLHLGNVLKNLDGGVIDLSYGNYRLKPNEFILGSTCEWVNIPNDLVGQVDGKSSIARLGVEVHRTAGWIDSGFKGNITLEIHNCGTRDFCLHENMLICQIIFLTLSSPCVNMYGDSVLNSHYQDSYGTVLSKYDED